MCLKFFCCFIYDVKVDAAICVFNVQCFQCHYLPVILALQKQSVLLLDNAKCYLLLYYFNLLYYFCLVYFFIFCISINCLYFLHLACDL